MINFIIYSSNNNLNKKTKEVVLNFMVANNMRYKVYIFKNYSNKFIDFKQKLVGQNIYILNISDEDKEALLFAKNIRSNKLSMNDQIIFITSKKKLILKKCYSEIMYYDFLIIDDNYEKKIKKCLMSIIKVFNRMKFLVFKVKSEIYRIPYNDVNYIEKCKNDDCSYIHTRYKIYKCKTNLVTFEKMLNNGNFYKTHRSCIVNINNIEKINTNSLKIYFSNESTNYLSRDRKKDLLNSLACSDIDIYD